MSEHRLNLAEQHLARYLAKKRQEYNRRMGIPNRKVMNRDPLDVEIDGVAAELCFCRIFNLYPDTEVGHHLAYDAVLHSGLTVDVKCTWRSDGRLLVELEKEDKKADLYALMIGADYHYRFRGFAVSAQVFRPSRWQPQMPKPCWALDQKLLLGEQALRLLDVEASELLQ